MNGTSVTGIAAAVCASRARACRAATCTAIVLLFGAASQTARAVDGCLALLCFTAPDWSAIQQCVPPVQQVLSDLAHGKPFPSCSMAGAGNNANNQAASVPGNCPPQYVAYIESDSGIVPAWCAYDGVISVTVNGIPWLNTWWSLGSGTVTDFSPAAKAQFGAWDSKFEDDYAAWAAAHPPMATFCSDGC